MNSSYEYESVGAVCLLYRNCSILYVVVRTVTCSLFKSLQGNSSRPEGISTSPPSTLVRAGGVVFVLPNDMGQVAVTLVLTVMFALLSESLAPYRSTWDSWISRIGHVVVFLSVFVAFLAFYVDDGNGNSGRRGV